MSTAPTRPDLISERDLPADFGRYRLLGLLGEGGMARVFRAEVQGTGGFRKAVALKVIHGHLARSNQRLHAALKNEARLGALLQHPNIVDTYDYGEVDGQPYIAMELVKGMPLDRLLHDVVRPPARVVIEIAAQICAGLAHAHDAEDGGEPAHLVHRDLKPSNVIISRDGAVKVMDFGIAKAATSVGVTTDTGLAKGTPAYMSPEQVAAQALDRRSDIFALGALLYELASGKRLFQGDSLLALTMRIVRVEEILHEDDHLAEVERQIPGLGPIIERCLRKDRDERYDDATEVEAALRALLPGLDAAPPLRDYVRQAMAAAEVTLGGRAWDASLADDEHAETELPPTLETTARPPPLGPALEDTIATPPPASAAAPPAAGKSGLGRWFLWGAIVLLLAVGIAAVGGLVVVRALQRDVIVEREEPPTPLQVAVAAAEEVTPAPRPAARPAPKPKRPRPAARMRGVSARRRVVEDATREAAVPEGPLQLDPVDSRRFATTGLRGIFRVGVQGGGPIKAALVIKPARGDWERHLLEHAGKVWSWVEPIPTRYRGPVLYYFEAWRESEPDRRWRAGSSDAPLKMLVR